MESDVSRRGFGMGGNWSRRRAVGAGLSLSAIGLLRGSGANAEAPEYGAPEPFSFERLVVQAKEIAQQPFQQRTATAKWLTDLSPDQYRTIRYRADRAVPLNGSPFSLQLFHLGSYHQYPDRKS